MADANVKSTAAANSGEKDYITPHYNVEDLGNQDINQNVQAPSRTVKQEILAIDSRKRKSGFSSLIQEAIPNHDNNEAGNINERPQLAKCEQTNTGMKPYNCKCGKYGFGRSYALKNHEQIYQMPYDCNLDGKCFRISAALVESRRRLYERKKPVTTREIVETADKPSVNNIRPARFRIGLAPKEETGLVTSIQIESPSTLQSYTNCTIKREMNSDGLLYENMEPFTERKLFELEENPDVLYNNRPIDVRFGTAPVEKASGLVSPIQIASPISPVGYTNSTMKREMRSENALYEIVRMTDARFGTVPVEETSDSPSRLMSYKNSAIKREMKSGDSLYETVRMPDARFGTIPLEETIVTPIQVVSPTQKNSRLKRQVSSGRSSDGHRSLVVGQSSDEECAKRVTHNVLEQKRRSDLKNSFHQLRVEVPELEENERSPKVTILRKARDYVEQLETEENILLSELDQEHRRHVQLLQRLLAAKPTE